MQHVHIVNPKNTCLSYLVDSVGFKGVGPSTTLAWPGWKQPDISVKVDTAQLETGRFKKCCVECLLLYYPSTEFESTIHVY
jgi:hypothetical protein